ncbi:response regulator [Ectobacillus ponti]|uniref:Response regulator n=1 Tax=Ectobacillus ponti TaxID=2961894 RepID=A0AA41X3A7_9BACI|nr:response regulator [Ectobacillus ponti]MCP8967847.1 response regulator [Ectobacillus ponti]
MARILVVDDAMFMRNMLRTIFEKAGHTVVAEAGDGLEAAQAYFLHKPDVVTMDITMPGANGIEAIQTICESDPHAKIIVCSAMGQQSIVIEAVRAGARDFIVKPFEAEAVLHALGKLVS